MERRVESPGKLLNAGLREWRTAEENKRAAICVSHWQFQGERIFPFIIMSGSLSLLARTLKVGSYNGGEFQTVEVRRQDPNQDYSCSRVVSC